MYYKHSLLAFNASATAMWSCKKKHACMLSVNRPSWFQADAVFLCACVLVILAHTKKLIPMRVLVQCEDSLP